MSRTPKILRHRDENHDRGNDYDDYDLISEQLQKWMERENPSSQSTSSSSSSSSSSSLPKISESDFLKTPRTVRAVLSRIISDCNHSELHIGELISDLVEKERRLKKSNSQVETLKKELARLKAEPTATTHTLPPPTQPPVNQTLQRENEALQKDIQALQRENDALKKKIDSMGKENETRRKVDHWMDDANESLSPSPSKREITQTRESREFPRSAEKLVLSKEYPLSINEAEKLQRYKNFVQKLYEKCKAGQREWRETAGASQEGGDSKVKFIHQVVDSLFDQVKKQQAPTTFTEADENGTRFGQEGLHLGHLEESWNRMITRIRHLASSEVPYREALKCLVNSLERELRKIIAGVKLVESLLGRDLQSTGVLVERIRKMLEAPPDSFQTKEINDFILDSLGTNNT